jgi:hypothetical protein
MIYWETWGKSSYEVIFDLFPLGILLMDVLHDDFESILAEKLVDDDDFCGFQARRMGN